VIRLLVSVLLLWLVPGGVAIADSPDWRDAAPGHDWSFPRDHHAMPGYRSEWWYLTGQVAAAGADAPTHGLQLTIFRLGLAPERPPWRSRWAARDLVLGHLAVTEFASGRHRFREVLTRAGPGRGGFPAPGDSVLAWVRGPAGTDEPWEIVRREDGFAVRATDARAGLLLDLDLAPERAPVFHGPDGYSEKDGAAGSGSLYYSFTRLAARGRVAAGADTLQVRGRCWFDREVFTSQLAPRHVGWMWLGVQLADGRDLMAFALRDTSGAVDVTHATLVDGDGDVRWFDPPRDFLQPRAWWTSEETGGRYPVSWRVALPAADLHLDLAALAPAQENVGPRSGIVYWEGAVAGQTDAGVACRGYVELTGYGGGRLPF
jgi:predicted secreted hydrolase